MVNSLKCLVEGSAKRRYPGLVNFVTAVAHHFCLALPAAFTQPGDNLLAEVCMFGSEVISRTLGASHTKKKRREKSLLEYLTNVAKEVILSPEGEAASRPYLASCDVTKSRWKMDAPFEWRH